MQEKPRPAENHIYAKREAVSRIALDIEKEFPPRERPVSREINRHTDDMDLSDVWPKTFESLSNQVKTQEIRVGLVVGAGGAPSTFPELLPELDLLVFTDNDQRVLNWVKSTLDNLDKYPKADLYERLVYSDNNPYLQERGSNYGANIYTGEIESWGNFHFLDTDRRYKKVRQAYLQAREDEKKISYANLDLGDPKDCTRLADTLGSDSKIVYSNLTNVSAYIAINVVNRGGTYSRVEKTLALYMEGLRTLPFAQDAVIQFSDMENRRSKPQADMTTGVESYLEKAVHIIPY